MSVRHKKNMVKALKMAAVDACLLMLAISTADILSEAEKRAPKMYNAEAAILNGYTDMDGGAPVWRP